MHRLYAHVVTAVFGKELIEKKVEAKKKKYDYSQEEVDEGWHNKDDSPRSYWPTWYAYIFAALAYVIGTGNLQDFPNKCYTYGMATFLIPFLLTLFIIVMPLLLMETALGQYTSESPMTCWKMAPILKAIGVGSFLLVFLTSISFPVIPSWAILYTGISLVKQLPWSSCNHDFNSLFCRNKLNLTISSKSDCELLGLSANDTGVCFNGSIPIGFWNMSLANQNDFRSILPAEEYWHYGMLGMNDHADFEHLGYFRWPMLAALAFNWIIVFLFLRPGLSSTSIIVYLTIPLSFAIIFILMVYFLTLDGAVAFIAKDIKRFTLRSLFNAELWIVAAKRNIYSIASLYGVHISLASHNTFHNNCLRNTMLICLMDAVASICAAFLIYSLMGYLSVLIPDFDMTQFMGQGLHISFIASPMAIANLPSPELISVLFFFVHIILSIDVQLTMTSTIITSLQDSFPALNNMKRRGIVLACLCIFFYTLSLPFCTEGGIYVYELVDYYTTGVNLFIIGVVQCIGIGWIYGASNFCNDIGVMMGNQTVFGATWKFWSKLAVPLWAVIIPVFFIVLLVFELASLDLLKVEDYGLPGWSMIIGISLQFFPILGILGTCLILVIKSDPSGGKKFTRLFTPDKFWGPALVTDRVKVVHVPGFDIDPGQEWS